MIAYIFDDIVKNDNYWLTILNKITSPAIKGYLVHDLNWPN